MRTSVVAVVIVACLAGCMREGAGELLETAKLEELQQNVPHARELYERIVADYPDSAEAKHARERLAALGAAPSKP